VDTFLQFFRAYYDKKGYLIYNLSTIRKTYIRSGWFFFNLLSSIPTSLLVWAAAGIEDQDDFNEDLTGWDRALMVLDVFKLLRLFRLKRLMKTSSVVDSYWERMNVMATSEYSFELNVIADCMLDYLLTHILRIPTISLVFYDIQSF
jgi:hypothetical protein